MTFLNEEIKTQVREFLSELNDPVEILFFGDRENSCEYCMDTRGLLEEVAALNDQLTLRVYDLNEDAELARKYGIDKAPGFTIVNRRGGDLTDYSVRFAGIPAGHEFTSLINDILLVSKGDSGLSKETRAALSQIDQPVNLQVFVTPTCPYCPQAVILAHQMAMESPFIQAEMVEAMEFNSLANHYGVSGVPHTVINDGAGNVIGAVPEDHLLEKIREALSLSKVVEKN